MKNNKITLPGALFTLVLLSIITAIIYPAGTCTLSRSTPKEIAASQIRRIAMAIELYRADYQVFPNSIKNLSSKGNPRGKLYYSGKLSTADGAKIYLEIDYDGDGFVKVNQKKIKQKFAIWTEVEGHIIKSWDD